MVEGCFLVEKREPRGKKVLKGRALVEICYKIFVIVNMSEIILRD